MQELHLESVKVQKRIPYKICTRCMDHRRGFTYLLQWVQNGEKQFIKQKYIDEEAVQAFDTLEKKERKKGVVLCRTVDANCLYLGFIKPKKN